MSRFVCLVLTAFAALLMLSVHAAGTKKAVSFRVLDDDKQDADQAETMDTTSWPSLRLDFKIKQKSMRVYGHSNFSITANPVMTVQDKNVLYDTSATFTEGTTRHKYVLVNGTAYLTSTVLDNKSTSPVVKCLDWNDMDVLSLVNSLVGILSEAEPSKKTTGRGARCATGKLFKAILAGTELAVCSDSAGFTMHGSTMDVTVEYLEERANIKVPPVDKIRRREEAEGYLNTLSLRNQADSRC
ncbi:hypothetical protein BBJ29_004684 [Phytophthora kernoviae]|uniref:Uncharacterized protein n=1 Tax=Phytophthora kernoviae TaxID=325452 RepID=A0A3F2RV39_9STRA|nr:hypothetical protein BBJ29_004684 [Phytophthora kernoviae]RLN64780.1 hypothetical protein BBP00_00003215 [Phytophthora kernoviae]